MKKITLTFLCLFFFIFLNAQTATVKGKVIDAQNQTPLVNVTVLVNGTTIKQLTRNDGGFELKNVATGNQIIEISFIGYETQSFPVILEANKELDMGIINLYIDLAIDDSGLITLSENDLSDGNNGGSENISGLLQASRDVFLNAAAFNFGRARFRVRGYDSNKGFILMNGIEMNKLYDGRPQWGNWGGLNDVLRNQVFSNGLTPSDNSFGGLLGTTNYNTRASNYRKGSRISLSATNGNYLGRLMATHSTGLSNSGFAITASASRRWAQEGYFEGTTYDAWAAFLSVEKKINDKHSLNLTAFIAPNKRGKSSPNTQEVFDLKGNKYNSYWGYQNGEKRNSRVKEVVEPMAMLSHYWNISDNTILNTNVAFQGGKIGNSRIAYSNANNPDPTYYRNLPSYAISNSNPANSAPFVNGNGSQIQWDLLYQANATQPTSVYALFQDRTDDQLFSANTILNTTLSENITLNANLSFKNLTSENFAYINDLLGGTSFLDIDAFASGNAAQSDLNNPNRTVGVNERFSYNYDVNSTVYNAFAQLQFSYTNIDFFIAANAGQTSLQRDGKYRNGHYANNSFGKSVEQTFTDFCIKAGVTYKFSGRHLLMANGAYLNKVPYIRNAFANARLNNDFVPNITTEKIQSGDISYVFRSPLIKARLTGYYTQLQDASEIQFFFTQGIGTTGAQDFVSQIMTGVDKKHYGGELGIEAQITPTIKLTAVAAMGESKYDSNPNLYLSSDEINITTDGNLGTTQIKEYHLSAGPKNAFSFGIEYRNPKYWWIGANANHVSDNYINFSPLYRTDGFKRDPAAGQYFPGLGPNQSSPELDQLLAQEKLNSAFIVNLVGGKSWRIKNKYIGFFASINNLFSAVYKTGGFEQSRLANFNALQTDRNRQIPQFGNRYWHANELTFFVNLYLRF